MRSRFSAFALGLGRYLVDSLTDDHEDRMGDDAALALALSRSKDEHRFMGLEIVDAPEPAVGASEGFVTFRARVFEKGKDVSFTERSRFVKDHAGRWRYASGEMVP